jgi:peptidyl-prolyl cis-trans isomerase C
LGQRQNQTRIRVLNQYDIEVIGFLLRAALFVSLKRRRSHPRPWLSSHKLGRPVGLANPIGFGGVCVRRCFALSLDREGADMNIAENLRRGLREPLVHFLLAGLAVFAVSAWRGEAVDPASRAIEIDAAQVSVLAQRFVQTWQRAPTAAEIDGLIRDHIKEEVYYREALRLGLEADDAIIRRRLRAKMEYLATAQAENAVADSATLQRYLDRNAARYATGARYSFDQIYLGDGGDAAAVKAQLARGGDWRAMGRTISLPRSVETAERSAIGRDFGEGFAAALSALKPGGDWAGPIASGFGQHLVRVRAVTAGRKPVLTEVRQRVENDWRSGTSKAREAKAYQALLDGYTITIAKP